MLFLLVAFVFKKSKAIDLLGHLVTVAGGWTSSQEIFQGIASEKLIGRSAEYCPGTEFIMVALGRTTSWRADCSPRPYDRKSGKLTAALSR